MSKKALAQLDKLKPNKKSTAERSSQVEEPAPTKKTKAERKADAAPKAQPSQPSEKAKEAPKGSPKVNTLADLCCALFGRLLSLPGRHVERFDAKFRKLIFGIMPPFPHYRSATLSSPKMQHSDLVVALNTLALVAFEECHLEYTAIAAVFGYGNTPMRLHTHMNNHSPISGIITVGGYVGGALFVEEGGVLWEGGVLQAIGTNDGRQVRGSLHDVSRGVKFDSHALHGPWLWDDPRIALVYYSRAAAQQVTSEEQQHMRQMGFPIGA